MRYRKHIFVCTNERNDGRKSCGADTGMSLVEEFKRLIQEHQLQIEVRAQKAGCFDVCAFGSVVVVYPDAIFYGNVGLKDVEPIFKSHILNNTPFESKKINFPPHLQFIRQ